MKSKPAAFQHAAGTGRPSTGRELPVRKFVLVAMLLATSLDYRFFAGVPGIPSFTLLEIASIASFFLLFADNVIFQGGLWNQIVRIWRANPYIVAYFFWVAILAFMNLFRGYGFSTMAQFKDLLPSFVLVLVLVAYGRSVASQELVIKILMVGLVINLLLGVSQGLSGWPRPVALNLGSSGKVDLEGRIVGDLVATGLFSHPNGFAMFLIPSVAMLAVVLFNRQPMGILWRLAALLSVPFLAFALYKTQGKASIAWALVALVYAFLAGRPRPVIWWLMVSGTVAGVVAMTAFGVYESLHLKSLSTIFTRIQLWRAGIEAIQSDFQYMLFGAAFHKVFQLSIITTGFRFPYPNAHNAFLNQVISYGFPGLVFYLLAIYRATRSLCIHVAEEALSRKMEGMAVFVLAGTFALLGEYFFEPAAEGVSIQAQFFLLLGLCAVLGHPAAAAPTLPRGGTGARLRFR